MEIVLLYQLSLGFHDKLIIFHTFPPGSFLYNKVMRTDDNRDFVFGLFFAFNAVSTVGLGTLITESVLVVGELQGQTMNSFLLHTV